jgi:hypothetical protein
MDEDVKAGLTVGSVIIGLLLLVVFIVVGPRGCVRKVSSWSADAYGATWLVVQHAQDGSVINHWVLLDKSIGSESQSDGIYFTDHNGDVVHLSGHYVYMQTDKPGDTARAYLVGMHSVRLGRAITPHDL